VSKKILVWVFHALKTNTMLISRYRTLFPYKPAPMPNFDVKNPKFGPFLRASEVLEGLRCRKEKMNSTPSFLEQKIK
jgi:hypothetical protein